MENNKLEVQSQLSELIQQDLVNIITDYSKTSMLNLDLVVTLVQDINLLKTYDVKYIHNEELNEIISLMKEELKNRSQARVIALLTVFNFIENPTEDFKKLIYINLSLKVSSEFFIESFNFFNVLAGSVKELFEEFATYIFNDSFLDIDETLQIEVIFKLWGMSLQLYNDNEASSHAYCLLKELFNKAIKKEKTEVAFWLYYTPLHYFHCGTGNEIDKLNEKFKNEIEKPLEEYILKKLVPKYQIKPNTNNINKNKKVKVAFVMQRIIRHSTTNVLYSLLKNLMRINDEKYEFILYDLSFPEAGGSQQDFVEEFIALGVKYINLHSKTMGENNATYSLFEKCIKTRERLIDDKIDILIGLHTRVEYIFLYATRTAPVQIYWYHSSNAVYDIVGIDEIISHTETNKKSLNKNIFSLPIDLEEYNKKVNSQEVINIKNKFGKNKFILGYIGRLIKIDDNRYLNCVKQILDKNQNTVFLACGDGDTSSIREKIKDLGIEDRFFFEGFINTDIYGHVIDLFLASFVNGGAALQEFIYKKKPYVIRYSNFENIVALYNKNPIIDKLKVDNDSFILKSIYTKEDVENLTNKGYLFEDNPYFPTYSGLPFVKDEEAFIKVANFFINNPSICEKIGEETYYKAIKSEKIRKYSFLKVLDDITCNAL